VPDQAFLYASRVVLMSEGRVLALDTPDKALTESLLLKAYGVPVSVVEIGAQPGIKSGIKMVVPNQL
jgi:ABC-type cobalamin/Fe3+-siderophores transport system ATPase subunit